MALIWRDEREGVVYEVRRAGNTVRLYTDGVFHSSFNPERPVTGGVWDLLSLPAFFFPEGPRNVLLLGVGGGTVIRQLQQLFPKVRITGVDLSKVHLDIARRFFGVDENHAELIEADAITWLRNCRRKFDFIIDDLFGGTAGDPARAVALDAAWCKILAERLNSGGILAVNTLSPAELRQTAILRDEDLRAKFQGRFQLRTARDENAVGVFTQADVKPADLRRALLSAPDWNVRRGNCRLNFELRRLN